MLSVEVAKAMLDSQDDGKATLLESHRKEEKVCMRPPLLVFTLVNVVCLPWEVAMNTHHDFRCYSRGNGVE